LDGSTLRLVNSAVGSGILNSASWLMWF
jgi:hypothetical protein